MRSGDIFDVQPYWCRKPLPVKEDLHFWSDHFDKEFYKRVLFFDPTEIYNRVHTHIKPFSRYTSVSNTILFPKNEKMCACGCGKERPSFRPKWADEKCSRFGFYVFAIIAGNMEMIGRCLNIYYGDGCQECGADSYEIDHQWPVKFGGAGGWLSNYKKLCKSCHRNKTNADFGWKQAKTVSKNQTELIFPSAEGIF